MFASRNRSMVPAHVQALGVVRGGGGRGGGSFGRGGFGRGVSVINTGGWWGGGWWPSYYGYPYGYPYYGYGYPYDYSSYYQQPVQQAQAQAPCPTAVRLSPGDLDAVRNGQSIRLTGQNQCGQQVDVTVQRVGASQISGLHGGWPDAPPFEPPLDGDDGYGFSPFPETPPPAVGEYEPPPPQYGDPPRVRW